MDYILLNTYGSPENAYIVAGMLRSNGIDCRVSESAGSELFPAPDGGVSGTALYVTSAQADEAARLIKDSSDGHIL